MKWPQENHIKMNNIDNEGFAHSREEGCEDLRHHSHALTENDRTCYK